MAKRIIKVKRKIKAKPISPMERRKNKKNKTYA